MSAMRQEAGPARAEGRRRILLVCGSAAGGVRAHLGQCARILSAQGHDVVVEAPAQVLTGLDLGAARSEALEIGPRPGLGDPLVLARLHRLGRRADVVHAHGLRAGAAAALALGRRRTGRARLVVTLHNLPVGGRGTQWVGEGLHGLVCARADQVLAVSPDILERAQAAGATQVALALVPAPQADLAGQDGRAAADLDHTGGPLLLTVARLAPQKGLDLLLQAATLLQQRLPELTNLVWLVAGEGPELERLRAKVEASSLPVRFLGRRQDVNALMRQVDVVVQTSLWEGQPLAVQEALRAGAALVATDVGGTAWTAHSGAVLVAPHAEQLAGAVAGLLGDPAALEQARARSRAAAKELPGPEALSAQLRLRLRLG